MLKTSFALYFLSINLDADVNIRDHSGKKPMQYLVRQDTSSMSVDTFKSESPFRKRLPSSNIPSTFASMIKSPKQKTPPMIMVNNSPFSTSCEMDEARDNITEPIKSRRLKKSPSNASLVDYSSSTLPIKLSKSQSTVNLSHDDNHSFRLSSFRKSMRAGIRTFVRNGKKPQYPV